MLFGRNGSGKTQFVERMRHQMATDSLRYLAFSDAYGPATDKAYYLQLRWNQHDIDEETPTVEQLMEKAFLQTGPDTSERRQWLQHLYDLFGMQQLLDKYVILLSSGELRKFQLIKTLMSHPQTLILDNPFIGLDSKARLLLRQLLQEVTSKEQLTLYLVLSRKEDIPDFTNEIIQLPQSSNEANSFSDDSIADLPDLSVLRNLPVRADDYQAPVVIDMHDVSIRYGQRTILQDLNWTVKNGDRWALTGQNGSGKSTLLSLVCADNPQSYACDISLFGHQRGHGESIWDIKRHIGYVSPEMHRSYLRDLPTLHVVASGLKDTVGLYIRPTAEECERCLWWMRLFGIEHLAQRSFMKISSGEQRLALVARAFVKDPELLVLDEPLHGLDNPNRERVKQVIDTFCQRPNKTLIMVTHYVEDFPSCINKQLDLKRS